MSLLMDMDLGETKWRSEPTDVEESADELWLGLKYHPSPGSPRKALKCSNCLERNNGEHLPGYIFIMV